MQVENTDFNYYHSGILNLNFAVHKKTKKVFFEDGVKYLPGEAIILRGASNEIIREIHQLKKTDSGFIVEKAWSIPE